MDSFEILYQKDAVNKIIMKIAKIFFFYFKFNIFIIHALLCGIFFQSLTPPLGQSYNHQF